MRSRWAVTTSCGPTSLERMASSASVAVSHAALEVRMSDHCEDVDHVDGAAGGRPAVGDRPAGPPHRARAGPAGEDEKNVQRSLQPEETPGSPGRGQDREHGPA